MSQRTGSATTLINGPEVMIHASTVETFGVALCIGRYGTGCTELWLSTDKAREIAAALTKAADHYDAETARLAAESQKVAA